MELFLFFDLRMATAAMAIPTAAAATTNAIILEVVLDIADAKELLLLPELLPPLDPSDAPEVPLDAPEVPLDPPELDPPELDPPELDPPDDDDDDPPPLPPPDDDP